MNVFLIIVFAVLVAMCFVVLEASRKTKGTEATNSQIQKGKFDEKGRYVRETGSHETKIGHISIQTNKTRSFAKNAENDLVKDPPLSEAERNVILGK